MCVTDDLREHLQDLLTHPGWIWLVEQELGHWQKEMSTYITQAVGEVNGELALQKLRQIVAAKQAVERVFARPREALRTLTQSANESSPFSRRGPL